MLMPNLTLWSATWINRCPKRKKHATVWKRGLGITQLKRALHGFALATGALFQLKANGKLSAAAFDELYDRVDGFRDQCCQLLNRFHGSGAIDL